MSSSDSDSDSVEEVQIKRYLSRGLKDGIQQAKAIIKQNHDFIKPQPGHYQLKDCAHAVLDHKNHGYQGKHWETDVKPLQKATDRLTIQAVNRAVVREQQMRIYYQEKRARKAMQVYSPLVSDFDEQVKLSKKAMETEERALNNQLEILKDDIQTELLRQEAAKLADMAMEDERAHQIKLLQAMQDESKKTASIESLVEDMADTNYKRSIINTDLEEAAERMQDAERELDVEYSKAMGEMLDESLLKVIYEHDRNVLSKQAEKARLEKMEEIQQASQDGDYIENIHKFDNVLGKLTSLYHEVQKKDEAEEEKMRAKMEDLKVVVQEDLVRRVKKKWIDRAAAEEKARRIQEMEDGIDKKNPAREAMMQMMKRVQRQMLLQKFKGKWITKTKNRKKGDATGNKKNSEWNKQLR